MKDAPTNLLTAPPTRIAGKVFVAVVAVVSVATSAPPPVSPANVPMWSIASQPLALPCGTADLWVSKSGKTGMGITVRITPSRQGAVQDPAGRPSQVAAGSTPSTTPAGRSSQVAVDPATSPTNAGPANAPAKVTPGTSNPPIPTNPPIAIAPPAAPMPVERACLANFVGATLKFPDRTFTGRLVVQTRGTEVQADEGQLHSIHAIRDGGTPDPSLLEATYYYIAFELDNEARWNRGERTAIVAVSIDVGGMVNAWQLPATHAYREWPARGR